MKKDRKINIGGRELAYVLNNSKLAKRVRLAVYPDASIILTKPLRISSAKAQDFLVDKSGWIFKKIDELSSKTPIAKLTRRDYLKNRAAARRLIVARLAELNERYAFAYQGVEIRDQRTRWGSCSRRGRLSFNYRLLFLEPELRDYVIVHELCHLKEFNHSHRFWELVSRSVPDYKELRRRLKSGPIS